MRKTRQFKWLKIILPFLVITCGLILYACVKDESNGYEGKDSQRTFLTPEVAQAWYEDNYTAILSLYENHTRSAGFSHLIRPNWERAKSSNSDTHEVVVLPYQTNREHLYYTRDQREKFFNVPPGIHYRNTNKIVIRMDKHTGDIEAYLMLIIGDVDYVLTGKMEKNQFEQIEDDFCGYVVFLTLDGEFVNGWRYDNGRITGKGSSMSDNTGTRASNCTIVSIDVTYVECYQSEFVDDEGNWTSDGQEYCFTFTDTTTFESCEFENNDNEDGKNSDNKENEDEPNPDPGSDKDKEDPDKKDKPKRDKEVPYDLESEQLKNKIKWALDSYMLTLQHSMPKVVEAMAKGTITGVYYDPSITSRARIEASQDLVTGTSYYHFVFNPDRLSSCSDLAQTLVILHELYHLYSTIQEGTGHNIANDYDHMSIIQGTVYEDWLRQIIPDQDDEWYGVAKLIGSISPDDFHNLSDDTKASYWKIQRENFKDK